MTLIKMGKMRVFSSNIVFCVRSKVLAFVLCKSMCIGLGQLVLGSRLGSWC